MNIEPMIVGVEKSSVLFLGSCIIFQSMLILVVLFIKERKWGICFVTFTIGMTGLMYCLYPEITEFLKYVVGPIVFGGGD